MFSFKKYQKRIFTSVDRYLLKLKQQKNRPGLAFVDYFEEFPFAETGVKDTLGYRAFPKNTKIPFLCLRVPTGGGKTVLACEILAKTKIDYLGQKNGLVMWFVPTEAIYTQTLEKFRNPNDIHRQQLTKLFGNNINVFSKDDALSRLKPPMMSDGLTIIVSIIDSFSMGQKVYKGGVDGYESFKSRLDKMNDLLISETKDSKGEKSEVAEDSLFNIIRSYNPVTIIDEGHKYTTELIQTTLSDLNPSFIWEFTATPNVGVSNVLHRTSPVELKEEQMIKLPIQIHHQPTWEDVIDKAIKLQKELEKSAEDEKKKTGRYIRPIVLIRPDQITEKEDKITPKEIKAYIAKAHRDIKMDGEDRMLAERYSEGKTDKSGSKKVDTLGEVHKLFSPDSNIRYIIAYNAIREGWDCSFAYIYANLSNIRSQTDAEQFIGRILRMPDAKETTQEKLNKSYIVTKAKTNSRTEHESSVDEIINIMTNSGFSSDEAIKSVISGEEDSSKLPLLSTRVIKTKTIQFPKLSFKNGKEEEELMIVKHLWEGFDIESLKLTTDIALIHEMCGITEIDIDDKEEWKSQVNDPQAAYGKLFYTEEDLSAEIARACRDKFFSAKDQLSVISKWVKKLAKANDIKELQRNFFVIKEYYKSERNKLREQFAKNKFSDLIKANKITTSNTHSWEVPSDDQYLYYPSGKFRNHLYSETENLNSEEKDFISQFLEGNKDIKWFYRNRENKDFHIQGYWGKFYPDFVYQTSKGDLGVVEYKGREDDLDKEKKQLGETYAKLSKIQFSWNKI